MRKLLLSADMSQIDTGMEFIQQTLEKYHIKGKPKMEALLVAEEAMVRIIGNASPNAQMQISVRRWYTIANISISAAGEPFENDELQVDIGGGDFGHDSEEGIRSMLLHAYADKIAYTRKGSYNFVRITAGVKERVFALRTLFALSMAFILALAICPFISTATTNAVAETVLTPLQTVFLNSLQLVTAPAVFFSIMTAVARLTAFSDPGRIARKIIISYAITSVFAVLMGIALFHIVQPDLYSERITQALSGTDIQIAPGGGSYVSWVVNFVPDNIISPFLTTNSVQLLLIAVISGLALGRVGQYSQMLREIADALDKFFSGCVEIITDLIPTAVFVISLLMFLYYGLSVLIIIGHVLGLVLLSFGVLFVCYLLLIAVRGHLNPLIFLRKCWPVLKTIFLSGSSINAIPDTMRYCDKELGISPKIYSFSIPFGAISNLDGCCVYLTVTLLALSRLCGVEIGGKNLIATIFMVVVLSIGAPITPGSAMLALTLLMNQMGLPLSVISIVLGINAFIEMMLVVCNTVGDIAATLVVAKKEKLLDTAVYNQMTVQHNKTASKN